MTHTTHTIHPTGLAAAPRYLQPGWFTRHVFNRAVRRLTRLGLSVAGSRELWVRGRSSGQWRSTPVNLLVLDGHSYLVAPRGTTQWVRNLRAAHEGELRVGRRHTAFAAQELSDDLKGPVLREYLRRWGFEAAAFFQDLDAHATDAQIQQIATDFPVFQVTTRSATA